MQVVCVLKSHLDILSGGVKSFSKEWEILILTGLFSLLPVPGRPSGTGDSGQENMDSRPASFTRAHVQQLTCSEGSAS